MKPSKVLIIGSMPKRARRCERYVQIVYPRFGIKFSMQYLGFAFQVAKFGLFNEPNHLRRATIHASGFLPSIVP